MSFNFVKIRNIIKRIFQRVFLTTDVSNYINLNKKRFNINKLRDRKTEEVILIDFIDSYPVIETLAYMSNYLADKYQCTIKYFSFDFDKYDKFFVPNIKLRRIYASFNASFGFSYNFIYIFKAFFKAVEVLKGVKTKSDVVDIVLGDNLKVGSLIYDTYLRKYKVETLKVKSLKFLFVLFQTFLILESIKKFFKNNNIKVVIPGDLAYIYSGLVAKYALNKNIEVYSIVESNGLLISKMDKENYHRRMPYWKYPQIFNGLSAKKKQDSLATADELLQRRLEGKNDITMCYMVNSAYSLASKRTKILKNTNRPKILIALHDFFDSPHIYRWMLFPDFWEWVLFTLDHASRTDFEWYVKPHPNALPDNQKIIQKLQRRYLKNKNIIFIDPSTSNIALMNEGICSAFTVYSSIGHEFAFRGIPVVNSGDNPHISYDFNLHPQSITEYKQYIYQANDLRLKIDINKVREFFFMHYLYYKPLKNLNPVYPPLDYVQKYNLGKHTSKMRRTFYHKKNNTLTYLVDLYSYESKKIIYDFLSKVM